MRTILREVLCLLVASVLSWWVVLRPPSSAGGVARIAPNAALPMELTPLLASGEREGLAEPRASVTEVAEVEDAPPRSEEKSEEYEEYAEEEDGAEEEAEPPAPSATSPMPRELGAPDAEDAEAPGQATAQPGPSAVSTPPVSDEMARLESVAPASEPVPSPQHEEDPPAPESGPDLAPTAEEPGASSVLDLPAHEPISIPAERAEARDPPGAEPAPTSAAPASDDAAAPGTARAPATVMRDPARLAAAEAELTGAERRGFATVLLAAPEDQLAIARYFGEELVLVPKENLDPAAADPRWYRVAPDSAHIEELRGRAPLDRYRQYRDLFDYEYTRLPPVLRELRRSLVSRRDVYVFAALIPAREWAIVMARREEALAHAGRDLAEVRRFVLRYLVLGDGAFDLAVDHIVFADGSRHAPLGAGPKGDRTQ